MERTEVFNQYMRDQLKAAPEWTVEQLVEKAGGMDQIYLVFVDIIKGFCDEGALSSDRVQEMVEPVKELTEKCLHHGLAADHLIFLQDRHPQDAVEFAAFAPHCVEGTVEAEVVDALLPFQQLPGARVYYKNATNALFGQDEKGERFHQFLERRFEEGKSTFVVVGDCTDLCIYQNAMGIRLLANEKNADVQVVVPISHVRTYDMTIAQAEQFQILAHDAEMMDTMFLYHMQLNGVQVLQSLS
jgi:nicotinamidase-related amidase